MLFCSYLNIYDALRDLKNDKSIQNEFYCAIKIKIEQKTEKSGKVTLIKIIENRNDNYLIILIGYSNNEYQIFWKYIDGKIFMLNICKAIEKFVTKHIYRSMKNYRHSGVVKFDVIDNSIPDICLIDLPSLRDNRGYNILMIACEIGNRDVVDLLLKEKFDINFVVNSKTAADLAINNKHYGILLQLLKANSTYPPNINVNQVKKKHLELWEFIKISTDLHKNIKDDKEEEILQKIDQNPELRYFYTLDNKSAVTTALENKNIKIYKTLVKNSIWFGPKEKIKDLFTSNEEIINKIHLNNAKPFVPNYCMEIMMINSSCCNDTEYIKDKQSLIEEAYKYLIEIPELSPIIEIVAESREFRIFFDFKRDSTFYLDPTSSEKERGIFYSTGAILIGALGLTGDREKMYEVYGTLIHELCHCAMKLTYDNNCKPYKRDEKESLVKEFNQLVNHYCNEDNTEFPIMEALFGYQEHELHAELIVRVPHMIAEYKNDTRKLKECEEKYKKLFDIYKKQTLRDISAAIPGIKSKTFTSLTKFANRVAEKKKDIFWLSLFFVILIILTPLGMWLGLWIRDYIIEHQYECKNLNDDMRDKLHKSPINYSVIETTYADVFGTAEDSCDGISSEEIKEMLLGNPDYEELKPYLSAIGDNMLLPIFLSMFSFTVISTIIYIFMAYRKISFHDIGQIFG